LTPTHAIRLEKGREKEDEQPSHKAGKNIHADPENAVVINPNRNRLVG